MELSQRKFFDGDILSWKKWENKKVTEMRKEKVVREQSQRVRMPERGREKWSNLICIGEGSFSLAAYLFISHVI